MNVEQGDAARLEIKVYGFGEKGRQAELERITKKLEADGCELIECDKSQDPWVAHFQTPQGYTPKKWHDSTGWVIFWLIAFFPVGFYGLFRAQGLPRKNKQIIASVAGIFWVAVFINDYSNKTTAANANFKSYHDYKAAKELGLSSANYYAKLQNEASARQEEAAKAEAQRRAEAEKVESQKAETVDRTTPAIVICKLYVKEGLVSPSSADFPWPDEFRTWKRQGQNYIVKSHVESLNAFGVKLRSQWHCELQYTGKGSSDTDPASWELKTLEII